MLAVLTLVVTLAAATPHPAHSLRVDVARSTVTLHVFRSGFFAFAGDNHQIRAPLRSGSLDEPLTHVEVAFDARDLKVEDPGRPADKTAQVQARMLGPDVLDVARFPTISFRSSAVVRGKGAHWDVTGALTLRSTTRTLVVPVEELSTHHYRGSVGLRQSEFGIRPISLAGGAVRVKDGMTVDFDIVTR